MEVLPGDLRHRTQNASKATACDKHGHTCIQCTNTELSTLPEVIYCLTASPTQYFPDVFCKIFSKSVNKHYYKYTKKLRKEMGLHVVGKCKE